jgi:hypothetical protein
MLTGDVQPIDGERGSTELQRETGSSARVAP